MHSNSTARRRNSEETQTAPLQERSRATRDRILGSLAGLLQNKAFDQISVAELIAAADCSMSSFYARFPTKDLLLSAFHDRFFEVSAAQMSRALSAIESETVPAKRMRTLVEFVLRSYRGNRGLLRSLILHNRTHLDSGFATRTRAHKQQMLEAFLAVMRVETGRSAGPRARLSVRFGLWLVVQAIEQIVLFDDPMMGPNPISERDLVEQLTAVLTRATELRESASRRRAAQ